MGIKRHRGFTIVELLIVIVVIGVLAAITVVAYNGVTTRANNSARIASAAQVLRLLHLYHISYDTLPNRNADNSYCVTKLNSCAIWNGTAASTSNATMISEIAKVGTLPASVPRSAGGWGLTFVPSDNMSLDLVLAKVSGLLIVWLDGYQQDCTQIGGYGVSVTGTGLRGNYDYTRAQYATTTTSPAQTKCYLLFQEN